MIHLNIMNVNQLLLVFTKYSVTHYESNFSPITANLGENIYTVNAGLKIFTFTPNSSYVQYNYLFIYLFFTFVFRISGTFKQACNIPRKIEKIKINAYWMGVIAMHPYM